MIFTYRDVNESHKTQDLKIISSSQEMNFSNSENSRVQRPLHVVKHAFSPAQQLRHLIEVRLCH